MSATKFKIQPAVQVLEYLLLLPEQNGMGVANGRVPFKKKNMELPVVYSFLVLRLALLSLGGILVLAGSLSG